ncbi:cytochrome P450 [Nocardiopsis mangrovi]|uniref:Cytochrome P450 n=1 Tax=Nocardiopsis mangrovi TaxID=1179818 RepID=A0ABV9E7C3_9ACTN
MSDSEALPCFPFSHRGDALSPRYRELQRNRPVTRVLTRAGDPAWLITSHELAVRALQDDRLSVEPFAAPADPGRDVPAIPTKVLSALTAIREAGLHKVFMKAIAPPKARKLQPWVRATARARLDAIAAGPQPADLFSSYARALPVALTGHVMGIPGDDAAALSESSLAGLIRLNAIGADDTVDAAQAHDYFRAVLARPGLPDGIVRRFREHNAARPPAERVDDDRLADACVNVLGAGHFGAVAVLANTFVDILGDRPTWDRLCAAQHVTSAALEELLRYALVQHGGMPRVATEDVEIGGATIRAGELVLISADTADRDPAAFPGPDRVDLDRDGQGRLASGRGTHDFPGSALSRMAVRVAVEELTRRFPTMRLAVPVGELEWRADLLSRLPAAIPVTW